MKTCARFFARWDLQPSARWERRSPCSRIPSSRRSCRPARFSALYYADRLNQLPIGVIGIAIGTVLLPEMSRRLTANDHAGAMAAQRRAFDFTLLFSVPFVAAFLTVPDVVMRAMFARGAFSKADAAAAGATLAAYAMGLIPFVIDSQRGRDLLCAQGYRDAGQGRADRGCRQRRVEDRADGIVGPDRSSARDRYRRLDQSLACASSLRCGPGFLKLDREWMSSLAKFVAAGVVLAAALVAHGEVRRRLFRADEVVPRRDLAAAADCGRGLCLMVSRSC